MSRLLAILLSAALALLVPHHAALAQAAAQPEAAAATTGTASVAGAMSQYPPRPAGPVYDGAGILSPQTIVQLDRQLRDYNAQTGRAIIIATVPSLNGEQIEPYATGLFANWGIGGAERDMGLLLLIAPNERKVRIEIGYGMHPWFGGIMAGRIIRDVITPAFKADDYDRGVTEGVNAIIAHLAKSPEDAKAIEEAAAAAEANSPQGNGGFPIGTLFWFGFLFFFFILPAMRGGRRRRYRSGLGGTVGDIILWEAGKAAARGLSDNDSWGGGGGWSGGGGGGGFGGFGGGMSGGGGASGSW